jgi:hypothetical protein
MSRRRRNKGRERLTGGSFDGGEIFLRSMTFAVSTEFPDCGF